MSYRPNGRPSSTVFPNGIDRRLYFSDISIPEEDDVREFHTKVDQGQYSDAEDIASNHDSYDSDLFNMFDSRLHAIYNYLDEHRQDKPLLGLYQQEEPTDVPVGMVWIDSYDPTEEYIYPSDETFPSDDLFPD